MKKGQIALSIIQSLQEALSGDLDKEPVIVGSMVKYEDKIRTVTQVNDDDLVLDNIINVKLSDVKVMVR